MKPTKISALAAGMILIVTISITHDGQMHPVYGTIVPALMMLNGWLFGYADGYARGYRKAKKLLGMRHD